jgi:hypothetical protein
MNNNLHEKMLIQYLCVLHSCHVYKIITVTYNIYCNVLQ